MLHCHLVRKVSHLQPVTFFRLFFGRNLGTVGAVALDSEGNVAYATSTGGIVNKMVGRVGDTPCIGSLGDEPRPRCPSPAGGFCLCSPPLSSFFTFFLFLVAVAEFLGAAVGLEGVIWGYCFAGAFVPRRHPAFPTLHVLGREMETGDAKAAPNLPLVPLSFL